MIIEHDRPSKAPVLALLVLLVISFVLIPVVWDSRFREGYSQGYSLGYQRGHDEGSSRGQQVGYEKGYGEGYSTGNSSGFNQGYLKGVVDGVGRGYTIRDPAYAEAIAFVAKDKTDTILYSSSNFTCHDFSAALKTNAFKSGYRSFYVYIEFVEGAHALVAFNTTDRGILYIEPQDDAIMHPTVGKPYWPRDKYAPEYNDTVKRISIIP